MSKETCIQPKRIGPHVNAVVIGQIPNMSKQICIHAESVCKTHTPTHTHILSLCPIRTSRSKCLYRDLLIDCGALSMECMALLMKYTAFIIEFRAFLLSQNVYQ